MYFPPQSASGSINNIAMELNIVQAAIVETHFQKHHVRMNIVEMCIQLCTYQKYFLLIEELEQADT